MDTDYALIRQMKQGDEAAFDIFVHKYYSDILSYCSYHCNNKEEAKVHTAQSSGRFCGREWPRRGASGRP